MNDTFKEMEEFLESTDKILTQYRNKIDRLEDAAK